MSNWIVWILFLMLLYLTTITCEESAGKGEIFPSSTLPPRECRACGPGYGVTRICDTQQDTQCAPCPSGSYNAKPTKDTSCIACSSCPEKYYEWTPCSAVIDTVCESCELKPSGSGNEDYLKKCERTTTPAPILYPSSTKAGGSSTSDDLGDFLTKGQGLTSTKEDEEESGEGSGEGLGSPPILTFTGDSIKSSTQAVITQGESTGGNVGGIIVYDENSVSEASFSGWPILVAALVAALLCFVVGVIIGIILKRRRKSVSKEKTALNDPEVHIAMVPNGKEADPSGTFAEERTPIFTAASQSPDEVDWTQSPVILRNKPKRSALKTRSFGGSRDFRYIDEDSDDEMVQHLGRPPSIYFKDRKKRNKRKPLGLLSRLRRTRPKSQESKERKKVKRTESVEPKKDKTKVDESHFDTV